MPSKSKTNMGATPFAHSSRWAMLMWRILFPFLPACPASTPPPFPQFEIEPEIVQLVPRALAERHQLFPIDRANGLLRIGAAHPLSPDSVHEIEARIGLPVRAVLCNADDVRAAIDRYYIQAETAGPPTCDEIRLRGLEIPIRLKLVARLVGEIDTFPALPETVHRAREAMTNPLSSISDVSKIVVMDPPIAGKVLSVANSAAYGFPRQIEDLTLAMTLLGLRETYSIILSAAVLNVFEKTKHFDYKRFWVESMCCAAATRFVLKASGRRSLTGVFAAGLLHDIGRLVLAEVAPGLCRKIPTTYKTNELAALEESIIGISHAEAGYELALHWSLPPEIAESIRFHHRPADATHARETVAVIALADAMAHAMGANLEENRNTFAGLEDSLAMLKIDPEIAEAMLDEFLSRRDDSLRDALE